ncbi:Hypothetical predicted protein [Pelobates cultripes]|uniref:Uncharacterized protein n=1 Tax=Pelobates cultripes TaxID=61616 RepID=A0AAD1X046_PELCU|nr:Hypothetical predicted protein [Pelobates cultripes]
MAAPRELSPEYSGSSSIEDPDEVHTLDEFRDDMFGAGSSGPVLRRDSPVMSLKRLERNTHAMVLQTAQRALTKQAIAKHATHLRDPH